MARRTGGQQYFVSDTHADDALQMVATSSVAIGCDDEDAAVVVSKIIHYDIMPCLKLLAWPQLVLVLFNKFFSKALTV